MIRLLNFGYDKYKAFYSPIPSEGQYGPIYIVPCVKSSQYVFEPNGTLRIKPNKTFPEIGSALYDYTPLEKIAFKNAFKLRSKPKYAKGFVVADGYYYIFKISFALYVNESLKRVYIKRVLDTSNDPVSDNSAYTFNFDMWINDSAKKFVGFYNGILCRNQPLDLVRALFCSDFPVYPQEQVLKSSELSETDLTVENCKAILDLLKSQDKESNILGMDLLWSSNVFKFYHTVDLLNKYRRSVSYDDWIYEISRVFYHDRSMVRCINKEDWEIYKELYKIIYQCSPESGPVHIPFIKNGVPQFKDI